MSIQFSDTTNKNGLIQLIERNCGFSDGDISGNTLLLAQFTSDVNIALDKALSIIFQAGGTWQFDDSNYTDYPIITTNLVSGQRDYSFTTDGTNLVLDIYAVYAKISSTGVFQKLDPIDVQSSLDLRTDNFTSGQDVTGIPYQYDKTANGIFLDPPTNYNSTGGLKVYVNREGSYFTVASTTKKPGIAGLFHEYLALRPSYEYAYRKSLSNVKALQIEMLTMEKAISDYYGERERDVRSIMKAKPFNFR